MHVEQLHPPVMNKMDEITMAKMENLAVSATKSV